MNQVCISCNQELDIFQFEQQKNRPNPRKLCKSCRYKSRDREKEKDRHRKYMRNRRKENPDAVRKNWERSVYGLCKEDIGVKECMICHSVERLSIDHDHSTGKVRGILCHNCNIGLGNFHDNSDKLKKAVSYLQDGPHFQLPWKEYPA